MPLWSNAKPSVSPSGLTSEAGNYKDCLNLCGYAGKTAEGSGYEMRAWECVELKAVRFPL